MRDVEVNVAYRGLPAVTAWVKLKFTALNLKKLAIHKWMSLLVSSIFHMIEATLLHGKVASLTGCAVLVEARHFIIRLFSDQVAIILGFPR